jgi:hypothetical protein
VTDRQGDRNGRRRDQHQDTGGVSPALSVDVGTEKNGHQEGDRGEDQHQRAHGPYPVRGHPVSGQVPRDEVEQPGHGRRAGKPQDRDRARVIESAETIAQVLVRQEGQSTPVGRAAGPERIGRDQQGRHDTRRDQEVGGGESEQHQYD